ncbi:MAG: hypothetical protein HMLKMBBP_00976 [Planctomycetes bacterium]|nr:hypothetical protein [Planctomycetota bacterium]
MNAPRSLPPDLQDLAERAERAARSLGLDPPQVCFELVDPDELNMVAAYGGFPVRYPHWRFGMTFQHLQKTHEYGLSRIYELVVNNDPCYAYLMRTNTRMEQKLVMAHVYGHADFFRNNLRFAPTDRRMIDTMANHATRVRRHVDRFGPERVEEFLDACLSLENLIDPMALWVRREAPPADDGEARMSDERIAESRVRKIEARHAYMDPYLNPKGEMDRERKLAAEKLAKSRRDPPEPVRDVLGFLLRRAPLEDWQADCLDIVREEALYFAPQAMTKIANEGWASFIHSRLMTRHLLDQGEFVEYADRHSGTMAMPPGGFNPYAVGLAIFRDIEDRWDRGAHGRAWRGIADPAERRRFDDGSRRGWQKCLEVRRACDDSMLVDQYLTPDLMDELQLYTWGRDPRTGQPVILDRDPVPVKKRLLADLANGGQPVIDVADANHENRGELLLVHLFEGTPIREDFAKQTLRALHRLWSRPVHVDTIALDANGGRRVRWSFDGQDATTRDLGKSGSAPAA